MSDELNPDVFAGDVLRQAYRYQMDEHASYARQATELMRPFRSARGAARRESRVGGFRRARPSPAPPCG